MRETASASPASGMPLPSIDTAPLPRSAVGELGVMSGQPTFREPLHVGRPNVVDRPSLFARIDSMLDRRWLSNHGPFSHELEERIAELAEANEAVVVANATVGLEVLAVSLGLEGEVV